MVVDDGNYACVYVEFDQNVASIDIFWKIVDLEQHLCASVHEFRHGQKCRSTNGIRVQELEVELHHLTGTLTFVLACGQFCTSEVLRTIGLHFKLHLQTTHKQRSVAGHH